MPIEGIPGVDVDNSEVTKEIEKVVEGFESAKSPLVGLQGSVGNWERIESTICALRSANVSALLELRKSEGILDDDEILYVFRVLRDWDQLFLMNFLEICGEWVPQEFQATLQNEAKIELKWVKEWLTATTDQRISRYPSLPWRSFIRKIVGENHAFAVKFLELAAAPATAENVAAMHTHLTTFLEAKKKVVCVFPKKFKGTEH